MTWLLLFAIALTAGSSFGAGWWARSARAAASERDAAALLGQARAEASKAAAEAHVLADQRADTLESPEHFEEVLDAPTPSELQRLKP